MNTLSSRLLTLAALVSGAIASPARAADDGWVTLFNGNDLAGWTPKFAKHPLGANPFGKGSRSTGNLCTPGTHVFIDGKLVTQHIVQSTAPTIPPGEWVKIEIEVRGHDEVIHRVNGTVVLRYQKPQLDPACKLAPVGPLLEVGVARPLSFGHIALQAEGQGVWFRNIELKPLPSVRGPGILPAAPKNLPKP